MGKNLRAGLLFLAVYMFWGLLYPQYAITGDMYEVTGKGPDTVTKDSSRDYESILSAGKDEVEIHIALLDQLEEWFGEKETYEDRGK